MHRVQPIKLGLWLKGLKRPGFSTDPDRGLTYPYRRIIIRPWGSPSNAEHLVVAVLIEISSNWNALL